MWKISIIAVICGLFFFSTNYSNTLWQWALAPQNANTLAAFAGVFSALISLINVCVIIRFFVIEKKQRAQDEKRRARQFWFRHYVMDVNVAIIKDFFQRNMEIVEKAHSIVENKPNISAANYEIEVKQLYGLYTDARRVITENLCDQVRAIDLDFGNSIDKLFESFQDQFNENLERYTSGNAAYTYNGCIQLIQTHKIQLTGMLFDHDESNGLK